MKIRRLSMRFVSVAAACVLLFTHTSSAGKPDKPGGGNGGGDDGDSVRFSILELPHGGRPMLSDAGPDGIVTVAIDSGEAGYVSVAYALVDQANGQILGSGFLPEPPFVDPNDGVMKNGPSNLGDVNLFGEIVGYANTFDPGAMGDPSPSRAILWADDGSGYAFTLLPLLPGYSESRAFGNNNWGDIVGSNGLEPYGVAVLWHAASQSVIDLNSPATAAQGWDLLSAYDINDDGLIVGDGLLDGVNRGYVLDPITETVWSVPLIGPAVGNFAYRINANGRTTGWAWNAPYEVQGYSWSGPGALAIGLPPVTGGTSLARGLNDFGATVGDSDVYAPSSPVPTLWEFAPNGDLLTTELQTEIPSRPYTLVNCVDVNNELWIGARARKFSKGNYSNPAVILIPNN